MTKFSLLLDTPKTVAFRLPTFNIQSKRDCEYLFDCSNVHEGPERSLLMTKNKPPIGYAKVFDVVINDELDATLYYESVKEVACAHIEVNSATTLEMPKNFEILDFDYSNKIQVFYLSDLWAPREEHTFEVFISGQKIPSGYEYVGRVVRDLNLFVFKQQTAHDIFTNFKKFF